MKPKAVLAYCREKGIRAVDLRFPDAGGSWKHVTFPVSALTEIAFESGFGQEVTLRGVQGETREQMVLIPIAEANFLDPLVEQPMLVILASVNEALTREESWLDTRSVASRAVQYMQATGIADTVQVRAYHPFSLQTASHSEADGAIPRSRRFLSCGPDDADFAFRCALAGNASEAGVGIERHYRSKRSTSEMVLSSSGLLPLCDDLMMLRYMIEQMSVRQGVRLIHANHSTSTQWMLSREGSPVFCGSSHQGLSELGWHALGGILHHASTLAAVALATPAISCETEYPWLRLVSSEEPDALCNIILGYHDPRQRAIEFRGAPAMGNPYLQMAATLMAMIDGIQNKYSATWTSAVDSDPQQRRMHAIAVGSSGMLEGRLLQDALASDRDFLLAGDVFSENLLDLLSQYLTPNSAAQSEQYA